MDEASAEGPVVALRGVRKRYGDAAVTDGLPGIDLEMGPAPLDRLEFLAMSVT
jgi:hypothetical protein